jgi:predicted TPR repeat methyltransferase
MSKKYLDDVYRLTQPSEIEGFYNDWAASYDAEVSADGYITPRRCAEALARCTKLRDTPLLDVGCGTGLSGVALRAAGFTHLHGIDLSSEMLDAARQKHIYQHLTQSTDGSLPFADMSFELVSAIGVVGPGAAPPDILDSLFRVTASKGLIVLSLNDLAIDARGYEARLNEYLDGGHARLLLREYGDHLPGHDMKCYVLVIEKT